jgi:hypothetical protein
VATHCYYCWVNLTKDAPQSAPNYHTIDHVFARSSPRPVHHLPTQEWEHLNVVDCCHQCNTYKGKLHPLDWIVIMPHPGRAKHLGERLVKMGLTIQEVFEAIRRRAKK